MRRSGGERQGRPVVDEELDGEGEVDRDGDGDEDDDGVVTVPPAGFDPDGSAVSAALALGVSSSPATARQSATLSPVDAER